MDVGAPRPRVPRLPSLGAGVARQCTPAALGRAPPEALLDLRARFRALELALDVPRSPVSPVAWVDDGDAAAAAADCGVACRPSCPAAGPAAAPVGPGRRWRRILAGMVTSWWAAWRRRTGHVADPVEVELRELGRGLCADPSPDLRSWAAAVDPNGTVTPATAAAWLRVWTAAAHGNPGPGDRRPSGPASPPSLRGGALPRWVVGD